MVDLAVIVLSFNTQKLTSDCLKSIFQQKWQYSVEVWVVDNGSVDGSSQAIKNIYPQVKLIENKENVGFTKGNNIALKKAMAKYYLLLNSDTEVGPGALDKLIAFAEKQPFDIVSCRLVDKDQKFQPNAGELPHFLPLLVWLTGVDDLLRKWILLPSYQAQDPSYYCDGKEVGWISGSVMLIKDHVLKKIGFLDEKIFMYGEDVEYCFRARQMGFKVGWTSQAEIMHLGGGSSEEPHFRQWVGEFKGLLYIYGKYYGWFAKQSLAFLIRIFVLARAIAFLILKRPEVSKTYVKVLTAV